MKKLDLNGLGVQEMNEQELEFNNGGMLLFSDWWMFYRITSPGWGWGADTTIYA